MPNPCGGVHMPNFPCRECDRVRKRDATVEAPDQPERPVEVHSEDVGHPVDDGVASGSKSDRLAVAKSAVGDAIRREAFSAAEKQRRYREKHGDEYREREKERMRKRRQSDG